MYRAVASPSRSSAASSAASAASHAGSTSSALAVASGTDSARFASLPAGLRQLPRPPARPRPARPASARVPRPRRRRRPAASASLADVSGRRAAQALRSRAARSSGATLAAAASSSRGASRTGGIRGRSRCGPPASSASDAGRGCWPPSEVATQVPYGLSGRSQISSAGSSWMRTDPGSFAALRTAWPARSARARRPFRPGHSHEIADGIRLCGDGIGRPAPRAAAMTVLAAGRQRSQHLRIGAAARPRPAASRRRPAGRQPIPSAPRAGSGAPPARRARGRRTWRGPSGSAPAPRAGRHRPPRRRGRHRRPAGPAPRHSSSAAAPPRRRGGWPCRAWPSRRAARRLRTRRRRRGSAPGVATTMAGSPPTCSRTELPPDVSTGAGAKARPSSSAVRPAPVTSARRP